MARAEIKVRTRKEARKGIKNKRISKKKRHRSGMDCKENGRVKKVGRQVRCK